MVRSTSFSTRVLVPERPTLAHQNNPTRRSSVTIMAMRNTELTLEIITTDSVTMALDIGEIQIHLVARITIIVKVITVASIDKAVVIPNTFLLVVTIAATLKVKTVHATDEMILLQDRSTNGKKPLTWNRPKIIVSKVSLRKVSPRRGNSFPHTFPAKYLL